MQISLEKTVSKCTMQSTQNKGNRYNALSHTTNTFLIKQTQNSTYVYNIKTRLQYTKNPYAHSIIRTLGSYLTPHPNES